MILPDKLSRRAIRKFFPLLSEGRWNALFDREKSNGLYEIRVEGPNSCLFKAYYDLERLKTWLVMKGYYTPADFDIAMPTPSGVWAGLQVRTHRLAG